MTINDLEALKVKIENAKTQKAKAEGAMERIQAQWKSEFNVTTLEDAQALLKTLQADEARDTSRLEGLLADIEAATKDLE